MLADASESIVLNNEAVTVIHGSMEVGQKKAVAGSRIARSRFCFLPPHLFRVP